MRCFATLAALLVLVALKAHAQSVDFQVLMDDSYRSGGITTLRPDGGILWHGEITLEQAWGDQAHLTGPASQLLRLEWERADGGRGNRVYPVWLDGVMVVEGSAEFLSDAGDPSLGYAYIARPPASLKLSFDERDDSTGLATAVVESTEERQLYRPDLRVEQWKNGGWVLSLDVGCDPGWRFFGSAPTRLTVASMNCVRRSLDPGRYRRVVRLQLSGGERPRFFHYEQEFTAKGPVAPVVTLPDVPVSLIRMEGLPRRTMRLHGPDQHQLFCACDGLLVGRERRALRQVGAELFFALTDGGIGEEVTGSRRAVGDFPLPARP